MGKILAIGDIHTKIWIIEKVAKVINDYDKVILCGDYADDFSASPYTFELEHYLSRVKPVEECI